MVDSACVSVIACACVRAWWVCTCVSVRSVFLLGSIKITCRYPEAVIREQLTACIRRYRADIVFTWHIEPQLLLQPGNGWDDLGFHPDHQAVGAIALATAMGPSAGTRLIFPDLLLAGLQPYGVSMIFLWTFQGFSHYFDVTPVMAAKVNAMAAHRSQYPDVAAMRAGLELVDGRAAKLAGARGQYAELYFRICMVDGCAFA